MTRRALGWRKDKPDHRDRDLIEHRFAAATSPPPASAYNRRLVLDVLDQKQLGSCVANSVAQAVRMAHVRQGAISPPLLSRLGLYYLARAISHDQTADTGTYTRNACASLVKFGFAPESEWTYDDNTETDKDGVIPKFTRMPPANFFRQGFDQIAKAGSAAYFRITQTGAARITAIKRASAAGYGISFGMPVSEDFCEGKNDPAVPLKPPIGLPIAGGHELTIVGYDGDDFDVLNSWSSDWGDSGYFQASADLLAWSEADDFWIIETPPLYSGTQVNT